MLMQSSSFPNTLATGVRYPGVSAQPGTLIREVRCGQLIGQDVRADDLITLVDADGGTPVLLAVLDARGCNLLSDAGLPLSPIQELHSAARLDTRAFRGSLAACGGDWTLIEFAQVFDAHTGTGARYTFRAQTSAQLWIALPQWPDVISGGGGGCVRMELARADVSSAALPAALGPVRDEFRVDRASARAYEVQRGDYIQIIDVQGQQCSDFMAFNARELDAGRERFIDSAVTRTLVAGAYPAPGLFDKFYDQDMRPLLACVQDTVGRHDTFALACTARGYEERGFPGHINCSDNISAALQRFAIGSRRAWPAINFFFNSWILPGDNRLASDEAWSRPGDYVVMQALTDLVCVSTACPDDIDPINGWNPTDVHVRIYASQTRVPRAIAHRPFADSEAIMTEESAFHPRTAALTRTFAVARDVWLPTSYEATRAIDEYWACQDAVTLQDMSVLRKFDVTGPDAEQLLQYCLSRNIARLSVNRGIYALMLDDSGTVLDDGTLFRLAPRLFRWCCGSDDSGRQLKEQASRLGLRAWVRSQWSSMPSLAVQGPNSRQLLERVVFTQPHQPSLASLKWFGVSVARLEHREGAPFMLTRTGFTGQLGYEVFCTPGTATELWDAVMEAGADLGVTPMGSDALNMLRIEAGLMVAGAEFGPDIDAFEAGLGFAVDFKAPDFIGRAALARNRGAPRRQLVGLRLQGNDCPAHADPVFAGHRQVGVVTSATYSPGLSCPIAMARVTIEHAKPDTGLEIGRLDGVSKRLAATVTTVPFIDPDRQRARA